MTVLLAFVHIAAIGIGHLGLYYYVSRAIFVRRKVAGVHANTLACMAARMLLVRDVALAR